MNLIVEIVYKTGDEQIMETKETSNYGKKSRLTANPAPLGLTAFGMTTVLLNLHNAGFFTWDR